MENVACRTLVDADACPSCSVERGGGAALTLRGGDPEGLRQGRSGEGRIAACTREFRRPPCVQGPAVKGRGGRQGVPEDVKK